MKTSVIVLFILGVCLLLIVGTVCRPNFVDRVGLNTSGGLSHWLDYSIEFHPAEGANEARFTATLSNVSPYTLSIELNDKKFHASFVVMSRGGEESIVFDQEYRGLMLTSIWSEPVTVLAPSQSITWIVPLTSLVGELDAPVTEESLSGGTVRSEMVMAIVPKRGMASGYVSDNATQYSQSIQMPAMVKKRM